MRRRKRQRVHSPLLPSPQPCNDTTPCCGSTQFHGVSVSIRDHGYGYRRRNRRGRNLAPLELAQGAGTGPGRSSARRLRSPGGHWRARLRRCAVAGAPRIAGLRARPSDPGRRRLVQRRDYRARQGWPARCSAAAPRGRRSLGRVSAGRAADLCDAPSVCGAPCPGSRLSVIVCRCQHRSLCARTGRNRTPGQGRGPSAAPFAGDQDAAQGLSRP